MQARGGESSPHRRNLHSCSHALPEAINLQAWQRGGPPWRVGTCSKRQRHQVQAPAAQPQAAPRSVRLEPPWQRVRRLYQQKLAVVVPHPARIRAASQFHLPRLESAQCTAAAPSSSS